MEIYRYHGIRIILYFNILKMEKILFSDKFGLTKAVLDGRKTMTRRIANLTQQEANILMEKLPDCPKSLICAIWHNKSRFKVGEVVAIAQSYKDLGYDSDSLDRHPKDLSIRGLMKDSAGWKNKMFVKSYACKHHIKITNVKVERLQDISDEDCLKEGIEEHLKGVQYGFTSNIGYIGQYPFSTPRDAFAALIDKVSGRGTWERNPFVWVYEFKLFD